MANVTVISANRSADRRSCLDLREHRPVAKRVRAEHRRRQGHLAQLGTRPCQPTSPAQVLLAMIARRPSLVRTLLRAA